eukprot:TRINITY_DN1892_c0_g1_i1.p1 TRINITY_DN1892_c0_g1~~TRINITY_DN1892_c0_g1_i1.p1  ORF type:complete len:195 (+),score=32.33 TRINITY_DN1892_c0_g1_i1:331-915(+)
MNLFIQERDGNEALDLLQRQEPHVTVYLTEFYANNMGRIIDALEAISLEMRENDICTFQTTNNVDVSGTYVLWSMENSACLQKLSDLVVNATCAFAVPNQPIPSWVLDIQDPIVRQEKEEYVRKFGSPNVFRQFQPHITIAGDDVTPDVLQQIVKSPDFPHPQVSSIALYTMSIAPASIFGSVERLSDDAIFEM